MIWIFVIIGVGLAACLVGVIGELLWWGNRAAQPTGPIAKPQAPPQLAPQPTPPRPMYYIVLVARHREHAEALLLELWQHHHVFGWPEPYAVELEVDPDLPPQTIRTQTRMWTIPQWHID